MRTRTLFVVPLSLLAATTAAAQPEVTARVDSAFAAYDARSPGCAIGVAQNGRTLLSRAYGMADLEHDVPNTPETVFEAGSVSKQFTAAAIVLLARQGTLSLEDDVRRWIPEVPDYGTTITLRHLLNHTSGLRDWGTVAQMAGWPRGTRIHTHAHVLDIVGRQKSLNFTPGEEFLYSNSGYNLLAMVVERASGTSFAEFSRRELFEPLGMTRTQWRDDFTRVVEGRAQAYARGDSAWHQQMPFENVVGNGGLLTTVGDLLRWNQALADGTLPGLETLETQGVLTSGRTIEYALGLFIQRYRGTREVAHGGATAGYRAYLARYPEHGLSVAMLCNAADANPAGAFRAVDAYLGDRLRDEAEAPSTAVPMEAAELERRAGTYRNVRTGAPLRLVMVDGGLRAGNAELVPIGPAAFRLGSARIEFADGAAAGGRVVYADGDTMMFEPAPPADTTAANLATYAGEYRSDEAEATYTVAVEDGTVMLRMRPSIALRLVPLYADGFAGPGGLVARFIRGEDGRVEAFTMTVQRVRDLRFDRVR